MKRIAVFLLALTLLVLAGCSSSGDRQTEQNKIEDKNYGISFYYDTGWTRETAEKGISLKSPADSTGVSKARITVSINPTELENVAEYWTAYESSLKTSFKDYTLKKEYTGDSGVKLDGIEGVRVEYTVPQGEATYRFGLVLCINDGYIYNILLTAKDGEFDSLSACLETVMDSFDFTGDYSGEESADISGPRRAESRNEDFYFDFSEGWGIARNDGMTAIKPTDGGDASISVTGFSLPKDKQDYGVNDYWEEYEKDLKDTYAGYELTKEYTDSEPKLGGVVASRKDYNITLDGIKFKYIQVLCIRQGYVYSVMFTSNEEEYEKYSPEFDRVLASFKFT